MKHLVFIIIISLLISCQGKKENNLDTHKITFLTTYYEEYLNAAKKVDRKGKDSCRRKMREQMYIRYFTKCENNVRFNINPKDTDFVTQDLDILANKLKFLNENEAKIKKIIETSLVNCYKYLQYDSVKIYIGPQIVKKETSEIAGGVSGFTPGSKDILLFIDPYVKGWEEVLESTLAHEFTHAYWIKFNNADYKNTLLEWMICEGKAEAFSYLVYPKRKQLWDSTFSIERKKELWKRILVNLKSTDYKIGSDVMLGGRNGYPFGYGYVVGREIVESVLKKEKSMEPKEWINFSADYFFEKSGYK
jgi:uncharacterized protein YjaZ